MGEACTNSCVRGLRKHGRNFGMADGGLWHAVDRGTVLASAIRTMS